MQSRSLTLAVQDAPREPSRVVVPDGGLEYAILSAVHTRTIGGRVPWTVRGLAGYFGASFESVARLCQHLAQHNRVIQHLRMETRGNRIISSRVELLAGEELRARLAVLEERRHENVQVEPRPQGAPGSSP